MPASTIPPWGHVGGAPAVCRAEGGPLSFVGKLGSAHEHKRGRAVEQHNISVKTFYDKTEDFMLGCLGGFRPSLQTLQS